MSKLLLSFLTITLIWQFAIASGIYGKKDYRLIIEDATRKPLANKELKLILNGTKSTIQTNSDGLVSITIFYGSDCPSSQGWLARKFKRNKIHYYTRSIGIQYLNHSGKINKNWERFFKDEHPPIDHYCFETGELVQP